ncbi:MAG: C-terminal binding protein [Eubacteriaceae bacterium]|jgi:D-3-phosphoglycerate dehydrogenase|nr:C-terminal binding protein [Eubacteriaceae bacterium]
MFKVVRTFEMDGALEIEKSVLGPGFEVVEAPCATEEEIIEKCQDADAVICVYEPFTKRVIDALPNLKLIAFKSIGFNYADYEHAATKGIPVTHIVHFCTQEVADYATAAILVCNRMLFQYNHDTHVLKEWNLFKHMDRMHRLANQTIGLLGFGNIPRLVAKRLAPYGCEIVAYDPFCDADQAMEEYGVKLLPLEDVLAQSDIISLHLPLNKATKGIINKDTIALMKEGVSLINSARGPIIVDEDFIEAIVSGKIGFAVIDVLEEEYPDMNTHPFASRDNIVLTPHIAFLSQESIYDGIVECAENVKNFAEGHYEKCAIVNGVKPEK